MSGKKTSIALIVALFGLMLTQTAKAASPTYTTITVKNMHCSACAKKIAAQLYKVKGVKEVRADVKKNLAYVVPVSQANLSPKAMWEAVEKSGFTATKMTGPGGTFNAKPGV